MVMLMMLMMIGGDLEGRGGGVKVDVDTQERI